MRISDWSSDVCSSDREGTSPALQKQREKGRGPEAQTFSDHATRWLYGAAMAESTRAMRKSVLDRDILPAFNKRLLSEIHGEDLRALCMRVKARGAQLPPFTFGTL